MPLQDHMQLISTDDYLIEHPRLWTDRLAAAIQDAGPRIVEMPMAARTDRPRSGITKAVSTPTSG
jgi:hypothetical protein